MRASTETAHVSIFSVLPVRSPDGPKVELWRRWGPTVVDRVARAQAAWRPTPLAFHALRLRPSALILWTPEQPPRLGAMREELGSLAAEMGLPPQRFDGTHLTLARPAFDQVLSAEAADALVRTARPLMLVLERLALIRERIYPSLACEVLQ